MSAITKRQAVVSKMLSRVGKNCYTQSEKRSYVSSGYGDCSSTVAWAYLQGIGIQIGGYTVAQITALTGKDIDIAAGAIPNEKNLLPGDLLFFKGSDKSRPFQVGHVEMYIGNGKICGHGSGMGPIISELNTYCKNRYNKGKGYIKARRYIHDTDSASNQISNQTPQLKEDKNPEYIYYVVKKGDSLWNISKEFLGSGIRYLEIKNLNQLKSEQLNIGQKLKIPKYSETKKS